MSLFFLRLEPTKLCIKHNYNDRETFEYIMNTSVPLDIEPTPNKIKRAYKYFYDNLDINKIDFNKILAYVFFIGIELSSDEDEQQIFDTINSLGVKLSTGELLKNRFFDRNTIAFYETSWKATIESDEECINYWNNSVTIGRNRVSTMDNFLYSYIQIKMHDSKIKGLVSAEKKKEFRRFENLFKSYTELQAILNCSIHEFVCEIIEYAIIFKERFNQNVLSGEALSANNGLDRLLVLMYGLDVMTLRPYLLYIEKNVKDVSERNLIYSYIETYLIRRFICKTKNNNYSDLFTENMIGQNINSYKKLKKYIGEKNVEDSLSMPTNEQFKLGFSNSKMNSNTKARTVLYLMETKIRNDNKQSTILMAFENYTLEHLMPKNWRKNWNNPELSLEESAKRDEIILTMGNFAIISSSLNSSISDGKWSDKLEGNNKDKGLKYYSRGIETMGNVCDLKVWDEVEIHKRANWLANEALTIWKV